MSKKKLMDIHFPEGEHKKGFFAKLRTYFLTGILVVAPLAITFFIVKSIINWVDRLVTPWIPETYNPNTYMPFDIPGLGVIIVFVGLSLVGASTASFFGHYFIHLSDKILNKTPFIRSIYSAIKQVTETFIGNRSNYFRQVVLVEYPRRDIWAMGFITGTSSGSVIGRDDIELFHVFIPTTPNPTSGFLEFVTRDQIIFLDLPVEHGLKLVISGGIIAPDSLPIMGEKNEGKTSKDSQE